LDYVHRNAVYHRLVREPSFYPWRSAGWFERRANASFYKSVMRFGIERLKVADEFEVVWSQIKIARAEGALECGGLTPPSRESGAKAFPAGALECGGLTPPSQESRVCLPRRRASKVGLIKGHSA
jgi:hypothetical protein